jgi:hypothetical protein
MFLIRISVGKIGVTVNTRSLLIGDEPFCSFSCRIFLLAPVSAESLPRYRRGTEPFPLLKYARLSETVLDPSTKSAANLSIWTTVQSLLQAHNRDPDRETRPKSYKFVSARWFPISRYVPFQ